MVIFHSYVSLPEGIHDNPRFLIESILTNPNGMEAGMMETRFHVESDGSYLLVWSWA